MLSPPSAPPALTRSPVFKWLPDETFYSVCSRQHLILGSFTPSDTLAWLFGSTAATTCHDLPYNLGALNAAARAAWGDTHSIINKHTILPFFLPFRAEEHALQARHAMEGPQLGSLKSRLGLLAGRFGAEHPLKACTSCMAADHAEHGVAYWHLSHQYPGVVVCPVHQEMLRESCFNRQWSGRFQWVLPNEETLAPLQSTSPPEEAIHALGQIAAAVLELAAETGDRRFTASIVRSAYKHTWSDLDPTQASAFAQHCSLLQPYPPFTSLPVSPEQAFAFMAQLTRKQRGYSHPLKHLIAITWLYGSIRSFVTAYDQAVGRQAEEGRATVGAGQSNAGNGCLSRGRAHVPTAKHKPKVLKPPIRADILDRLNRGESKSSVCTAFGITVSTVNKLLRSEPEVHKSWLCQCLMAKRDDHRSQWITATALAPDCSPKDTRARVPRVYAWLYRNDREWLLSQTRALPSGRRGNHSRIDWSGRDEALLTQVSQALSELRKTSSDRRDIRQSLFLACPTLASALEKDGRYARTRAFLKLVNFT